jgi:hypothetical protein
MSSEISPEHRAAVDAMCEAAPTIEERRLRLRAARKELGEVCQSPRQFFRMTIPVQPDDTDMTIGAAFYDARASLDELEALRAKWESVPWELINEAHECAKEVFGSDEALETWLQNNASRPQEEEAQQWSTPR